MFSENEVSIQPAKRRSKSAAKQLNVRVTVPPSSSSRNELLALATEKERRNHILSLMEDGERYRACAKLGIASLLAGISHVSLATSTPYSIPSLCQDAPSTVTASLASER